jgi:uncharacterized protein YcfJ
MKKSWIAIGVISCMSFSAVGLADDDLFESRWETYGWARVIKAQPIVTSVEVRVPENECRTREVVAGYGDRYNVPGATIAGGLFGGLIGNQAVRGPGRPIATIGGAILGGALAGGAAEHANRHGGSSEVRQIRECRTIDRIRTEQRVDGYWVDYEFRGEIYRARLPERPGSRIRVRVTVEPMAP